MTTEWLVDGNSRAERVGPIHICVDKHKDAWEVGVIGGRGMLGHVKGLDEEAAKRLGQKIELALLSVASWAAREADYPTTRVELIETVENRIAARGGKRQDAP